MRHAISAKMPSRALLVVLAAYACTGFIVLGGTSPTVAESPRRITFAPPVRYAVPIGPGAIETADLDRDGNLDLLVVNGPNLSLLYGKGDGTFAPAVTMALGRELYHAIPLDADRDGLPDIAVCDDVQSVVYLLHNDGQRVFHVAATYPTGTKPYGLAAADFNEDGWPDLAVSNDGATDGTNGMCVLLNQRDGSFSPPAFYPGGDYPARVAAADLDGDGHVDLALSNYVSADVHLFRGDGTGRFFPGDRLQVEEYPAQVLVDDFNGDGIPDLATANTFADSVSVLFGLGGGRFQAATTYRTARYPHIMTSVDLDGDGAPDLAVPHNGSGMFSVLQNAGNGSFLSPVYYQTGGTDVRYAAAGDFDGDGRPDLVLANGGSQSVSVMINTTPRRRRLLPEPFAEALMPSEIDLAWRAPRMGRPRYRLERADPGSEFAELATLPPGTQRFEDHAIRAGALYRYRLREMADGYVSLPSPALRARVPVGGIAAIKPSAVTLRPVLLGGELQGSVRVRNRGHGELAVSVDAPAPFRVDRAGVVHLIPAGGDESIAVHAPRRTVPGQSASLRVRTNDPFAATVAVPIRLPGS